MSKTAGNNILTNRPLQKKMGALTVRKRVTKKNFRTPEINRFHDPDKEQGSRCKNATTGFECSVKTRKAKNQDHPSMRILSY